MRRVIGIFFALLLAADAGAKASPSPVVIAIAPVGALEAGALTTLVPVLRDAFDADVVVAPSVPIPEGGWNARRGQHLSTVILDRLARVRRPHWDRLLGVADVDLYVPDLNFVFGEADAARKVAVFSMSRLHPAARGAEEQRLLERRAATEAIHELGHTYGLAHCSDPHCVMWFSNTLAESDRKGIAFCARHAAELRRAQGK